MTEYKFIGKTIFFPEQGILAVGDLHIGYEESLRQSGVLMPEQQVKEVINDLRNIINEIKKNLKLFICNEFISILNGFTDFFFREYSYLGR